MTIRFTPRKKTNEGEIGDLLQFYMRHQYQLEVSSVVIRFLFEDLPADEPFIHELCSRVMEEVRPKTLTILVPSRLLSYLDPFHPPNQYPTYGDDWAFDMPFHILHLLNRQTRSHISDHKLWEQPWSTLTLNEGSSLKVYSTYEYYLKRPPSIFSVQSFCEGVMRYAWSSTVQTFEYVAIFPTAYHIEYCFKYLKYLHNLRTITTRLTPHETSSILSDTKRIGKCQFADLWMELRSSYEVITRFVQDMGKDHSLREFRPVDCDQANMAGMIRPIITDGLQDWKSMGNYWSRLARSTDLGHVFP